MNRKNAILSIFILGGAALITWAGIKGYSINKKPDIRYLNTHFDLINELAERIIPLSDTPGAKEVGAGEIILYLIINTANRHNQNLFIEGLKSVDQYALEKFGKTFVDLKISQQDFIVDFFYKKDNYLPRKLQRVSNKILGKPFFATLKYYTTLAYCTSKKGATQALAYDYIPGEYKGCIPIVLNQPSWATK